MQLETDGARLPATWGALAEATDQVPLRDPARAYLASLSPKGRRTMVERLRAVAALFRENGGAVLSWEQIPWHELRFAHVAHIRQKLLERGAAPATVNLTLAALRGVARYARNLNLLSAEEYDRIRDVRGATGARLPAGRAATSGELAALVRACLADRSPAGCATPPSWRSSTSGGAPVGTGRPRPGRLDA